MWIFNAGSLQINRCNWGMDRNAIHLSRMASADGGITISSSAAHEEGIWRGEFHWQRRYEQPTEWCAAREAENLARNCNLSQLPADFEAEMPDWHERCKFHQWVAVEYAAADRCHWRLQLCAPEWPAATEEAAANPCGRRCASLEKKVANWCDRLPNNSDHWPMNIIFSSTMNNNDILLFAKMLKISY